MFDVHTGYILHAWLQSPQNFHFSWFTGVFLPSFDQCPCVLAILQPPPPSPPPPDPPPPPSPPVSDRACDSPVANSAMHCHLHCSCTCMPYAILYSTAEAAELCLSARRLQTHACIYLFNTLNTECKPAFMLAATTKPTTSKPPST